jgi:CheY-like chemotaxis protein
MNDVVQTRLTVLVVEDDPMISQLLAVMLRDDYRVVLAATGREALAMARAEHPAVITLDLMLPDVPGREVLAHLAADPATASIPVIVISAYARGLGPVGDARVFKVVAKPFSPLDLMQAVSEAAAAT